MYCASTTTLCVCLAVVNHVSALYLLYRSHPEVDNVRGSVGLPVPGTRLRVVHPVTHEDLPDGQQGLILAQGPGVMAGYYNNDDATHKAFIDGWLDTGECVLLYEV